MDISFKITFDIEKALNKVADYGIISDKYKNYIANVYSENIITGYEDETFRPEGLIRAEQSEKIYLVKILTFLII